IDCLRADALYGVGRRARTPTLDRLVQRGTACTQAIASASSTTPCVASLLTGTYSFVHGIRSIFGLKLTPSVSSLVEVLRENGYHTYAEVSGPLFPETGLDRGFDSYQCREGSAYLSTAWGADLRHRLQSGAFRPPWFLFLHLWELHHRRHVLPAFRSRAYGRNRYERALSSLDAELGLLIASLPAHTLVVIHGDHGERIVETDFRYRLYRLSRDLLGRNHTTKREGHEMDVYEDLIRVPLVFTLLSGDGLLPAGKRVLQLVRQVDVLPTILDLVDLPVPSHIHGQSLKPALLFDTPLHLEAYLEAFLRIRSDPRDRRVGWRTEEWKYIYAPRNPQLPEELYFLREDPHERCNLATQQPAIAAEYRRRIEALQQGPLAHDPGIGMSDAEKAAIEKRLADLGYL
ncbi:MAG: sulfatase-like hydrolase/transferase, partial [Candidatus Binatia bacterium]|nr:sulfatase-like hydrolase/transferase [Candidatus Binatia bacterium]